MIAWTIYFTFVGAILVLMSPRSFARWIALLATLAGAFSRRSLAFSPDVDFAHFQTVVRLPWVPALGMNYHLAVDGISLTLFW